MGRCSNSDMLKKISLNKLEKSTEIEFRIRTDLPDCRRIDTRTYLSAGNSPSYNRFRRPVNRFECLRTGCVNTGTLTPGDAADQVVFRAMYDATEFAAGVLTFYVQPVNTSDLPVTITAALSSDAGFTNADVYQVTFAASQMQDDGYIPVVIDMSQTPASVEGTGWNPAPTGAYIRLSATQRVGYSSISIFESIFDFETNDVVKISCLSTIGGTYDLELVATACQEAKYNDQVTSLTFPVTGTKATPNYWKLNPMADRGSATIGFESAVVKKVIERYTGAGATPVGRVTLPDVNQEVCGFIAVQRADECNITDASLTVLSLPNVVDVDEGHFQILKNQDGTTDLIFNEALVGIEVLISYPKQVPVAEIVYNPDSLNSKHVSMIVPRYQDDGVKYLDIYENVFVTSFPATITNEAADFAFTIMISRDANGDFFKTHRILA